MCRSETRLVLWLALIAATISLSKIAFADCQLTSTGMTPVNDLGGRNYKGVSGGLYPNGANNPPAAHLTCPNRWRRAVPECSPRVTCARVQSSVAPLPLAKAARRLKTFTA